MKALVFGRKYVWFALMRFKFKQAWIAYKLSNPSEILKYYLIHYAGIKKGHLNKKAG